METSIDEAWKAFLCNGVHGQLWPQNVYAVVCSGLSCYLTKNVSKTVHAEDGVIVYLENSLRRRALRPQRLKLFLSASPCHRCSQRIITFLNTARWSYGVTLEMEVVFSAFYQIRRPSCELNPACRNHLPSYHDHVAQVAGLKKLYWTQGVILRTFNCQDWLYLGNFLKKTTINIRYRHYQDNLLRREFLTIMDLIGSTSRCAFSDFQTIKLYPNQMLCWALRSRLLQILLLIPYSVTFFVFRTKTI